MEILYRDEYTVNIGVPSSNVMSFYNCMCKPEQGIDISHIYNP